MISIRRPQSDALLAELLAIEAELALQYLRSVFPKDSLHTSAKFHAAIEAGISQGLQSAYHLSIYAEHSIAQGWTNLSNESIDLGRPSLDTSSKIQIILDMYRDIGTTADDTEHSA